MRFYCDGDMQNDRIRFIFAAWYYFRPISDGVHVPEDFTKDLHFFFGQCGDLIRRSVVRGGPHSINSQHIPPVGNHGGAASVVHVQFIVGVLCLDLLDPSGELAVQYADSFRHGVSGTAVLSGEKDPKRRHNQKSNQANHQHHGYGCAPTSRYCRK